MVELLLSPTVILVLLVLLLTSGVKIYREYERAVLFR